MGAVRDRGAVSVRGSSPRASALRGGVPAKACLSHLRPNVISSGFSRGCSRAAAASPARQFRKLFLALADFSATIDRGHMSKYSVWLALLATSCMAGCLKRANVQCDQNSNCDLASGGVCTQAPSGNKWCAYPSADCPSQLGYAAQDVGDNLAGKCVTPGIGSGSGDCTIRVAFEAGVSGFVTSSREIWTANADGTNLVNISHTPTADNSSPSWSPDGSKLVFLSTRRWQYNDIYLTNADGSGVIDLTPTNADSISTPVWSPDGAHIAFIRGEKTGPTVWTMNADGTQQARLSDLPAGAPLAWSPDSKSLAFSVYVAVPSPGIGPYVIYVAPIDNGAAAKPLIPLPTNPSFSDSENHATWAPGPRLVWDSSQASAQDIYMANPDGTGFVNVTQDSAHPSSTPILSRDGGTIFYSSGISGDAELWSMPVGGGAKTELTHNSIASSKPYNTYGDFPNSISSDGALVAFTRTPVPLQNQNITGNVGILDLRSLTVKILSVPGAVDGTGTYHPVFSSCPSPESALRTAIR